MKSLEKAKRESGRKIDPVLMLLCRIDVETIEGMAVLEFKHGDAERGKTLFEGLIDRYPTRLDLWSVYIDQLAKAEDIQAIR